MYHWLSIAWLLMTLVLPGRIHAGENADGPLALYTAHRDGLIDSYQTAIDAAQRAYTADVAKLDATAITGLIAVAKREARKPDKEIAIAAWKEVLRLDGDHADAVAFFGALGRLDAVRTELEDKDGSTDLLGSAKPIPEPVMKEVQRHTEGVAKARAAFAKLEGVARQRFREADAKAVAKAVKDLSAAALKADKAGNLPLAAANWKAVLTLDVNDGAARAYFTSIGRLDAVLAELPPARDVLGDPPDPGRGFAPVSLRGLTVVITGRRDAAERSPFETVLYDHCEKAGMVVTTVGVGELDGKNAETVLKGQQLVILMGMNDATRWVGIHLVRTLRIPVVVCDASAMAKAGLMGGPDYGQHYSDYTDEVEIKAGSHPLAAGLSGTVRLIDPLPEDGKPVAVEKDPNLVRVFGPGVKLPPGNLAVVVAGLKKDLSASIIGFETGAPMTVGESKAGEAIVEKLPARRLGFWMFNELGASQSKRLTRDYWRLWDGALTWTLRGTIIPLPGEGPESRR
jgi:hypothetical protein